jgi:hypothetical protein
VRFGGGEKNTVWQVLLVAVVDEGEVAQIDAKVGQHGRLPLLEFAPVVPEIVLRAHQRVDLAPLLLRLVRHPSPQALQPLQRVVIEPCVKRVRFSINVSVC